MKLRHYTIVQYSFQVRLLHLKETNSIFSGSKFPTTQILHEGLVVDFQFLCLAINVVSLMAVHQGLADGESLMVRLFRKVDFQNVVVLFKGASFLSW